MATAVLDQDLRPSEEYDQFTSPIWAFNPPNLNDFLDVVLPFDDAILEAMTSTKWPWHDMHHRSYFIP
jgi:hypothetical protein